MDEQRYLEMERRLRTRPFFELEAIADGFNSAEWGEEGMSAAAALVRARQGQAHASPAPPRPAPLARPIFSRPRAHPFPGADWKRLADELAGTTPFELNVDPRRYLAYAEEVARFARAAPGGIIALAFTAACILLAVGMRGLLFWPGLGALLLLFGAGCALGATVNVAVQRRLLNDGSDMGLFDEDAEAARLFAELQRHLGMRR
ncbi:MAG TPA: hypothetical protein PK794_08455 [Armatimonadota bacterium]|nr:hypothetical protein [Armatimonadota bacterium]